MKQIYVYVTILTVVIFHDMAFSSSSIHAIPQSSSGNPVIIVTTPEIRAFEISRVAQGGMRGGGVRVEISSSEMLCPFTIEAYPVEILAGDVVYLRMNFINTKDHPVYAPAHPLSDCRGLDTGILTYSLKRGSGKGEYPWKIWGGTGDQLGRTIWEEISPGQKGLTQYQMLDFQHTARLKCWDEIKTERSTVELNVIMQTMARWDLKGNWPSLTDCGTVFL